MAWNVGGAGGWGGLLNASNNALSVGMGLLQMRQEREHQQALEANAAQQTAMQRQAHDLNMAESRLKLEQMQKAIAEQNKPMDIKLHPMFLSLPDSVKEQALKSFADSGATNAEGIGKVGDIMSHLKTIESSTPLFQSLMKPVIDAKAQLVQGAWQDLQTAMQSNNPKKVQEAKLNFEKLNGEYHQALGGYQAHIDKLQTQQAARDLKTFEEEQQNKRAAAQNATTLKATAMRIAGDKEINEKAVIMPIVKALPKARQEAQEANRTAQKFDDLYAMASKGAAGLIPGLKSTLAPALEALGVDSKIESEAQAYKLMARAGAAGMRQQLVGAGQVSNYEQQLMQQLSGSSIKTSRDAAMRLFKYYANEARGKVRDYNDTLTTLPASVTAQYKPIGTGGGLGAGTVGRFKVEAQ